MKKEDAVRLLEEFIKTDFNDDSYGHPNKIEELALSILESLPTGNIARDRSDALNRNHRSHSDQGVSSADREALRPTNPQLEALRRRYVAFDTVMGTVPLWRSGYVTGEDLLYFRGDNCYVWQFQDNNTPDKYVLSYLYLRTLDTLGLFDVLTESADYGVFTFPTGDTDQHGNDRIVSRDLLDSVSELLFLERRLGISKRPGLKVLDIGAGYGRLAHRAATALDNLEAYFCIDAVPESTFLCDYYLSAKSAKKTHVVALDAQDVLVPGSIDLAVSILSLSECAIDAVHYWLSRCAELKIEHIFIVPNVSGDGGGGVRLLDGTDMTPLLSQHGYRLLHAEPKYLNPQVQKYGVSPKWNYLFRAA